MNTECEFLPTATTERDPLAYRSAIDRLEAGDGVIVFTPDDTHYEIACYAIERGCHVLVAKPTVKTVFEHQQLIELADRHEVLVATEFHKRWDPMYRDARAKIRTLGDFSFFQSFMSQPKSQLATFSSWAGRSSDISYYLNAHHIDFHVWSCFLMAKPVAVRASAATGVAFDMGIEDCEDTISLMVDWENRTSGNRATAIYTSSWIAAKSDVHSQQRFFYMGHKGEISIDQAHRGYGYVSEGQGLASPNPLFMNYTPDEHGYFAGQQAYGYRSLEAFVEACAQLKSGRARAKDFETSLATLRASLPVTAILEAGRQSLDSDGARVPLQLD
jgi:D-galacturonate reductase